MTELSPESDLALVMARHSGTEEESLAECLLVTDITAALQEEELEGQTAET